MADTGQTEQQDGKWEAGYVETNGTRLHYTRTGGSKPALVLAHGFTDDGLCWTPVAEVLETDFDVIMVDARCHGRSEAPDAQFGLPELVDDLAGAIRGLGLEQPYLLGHSMGAITALTLAGIYPDLVGGILLEDPPVWWMPDITPPASTEEWRQATLKRLTDLKSKSREQLIAGQRVATPLWSDGEIGPWADAKLRIDLKVSNWQMGSNQDWPTLCARITCPALLITGDPEKGAIVHAEQGEYLRTLIPHLQIAHIPGTGHCIRRDAFSPFMDAVRTFVISTAC